MECEAGERGLVTDCLQRVEHGAGQRWKPNHRRVSGSDAWSIRWVHRIPLGELQELAVLAVLECESGIPL